MLGRSGLYQGLGRLWGTVGVVGGEEHSRIGGRSGEWKCRWMGGRKECKYEVIRSTSKCSKLYDVYLILSFDQTA